MRFTRKFIFKLVRTILYKNLYSVLSIGGKVCKNDLVSFVWSP